MKHIFIIIMIVLSLVSQTSADTSINDVFKIGINDVLKINVLDNDELNTIATVTSDGTITLPFIGVVAVKGMSLSKVDETITKRLSEGYIKYPVVTVTLMKSMSRKIYVYGELNKRGEVIFKDGLTIIKALSLVGGVSHDGLFGKLKVRRKRGDSNEYVDLIEEDINNGFINDRKKEDMLLKPDDILIVERNRTFLIQGDVAKRGRMVLEKDMTVLRALLQAGGVTENGLYGRIKVRRKQEGATGKYRNIAVSQIYDGVIENKKVEDMLLKPDDIFIVERNKTFLIQGEVAKLGRMVLEKDMTVLRALLQAGGITKNGLYGRVKVRRKQDGKTGKYKDLASAKINNGVIDSNEVEDMLLKPDDILIVERNKTFLIQGEVAQRGQMVLEKDMTVLRAILQAGGVAESGLYGRVKVRRKQDGETGEYKDIATAKIKNRAIDSSEVEDMLLKPDDILIVERNKTFLIYGEVASSGEFVLKPDMTVFQAITVARGFSKWGSGSRVKILRPRNDSSGFETIKVNIDDVIDGDATADIILEPGDTVVVSSGVF